MLRLWPRLTMINNEGFANITNLLAISKERVDKMVKQIGNRRERFCHSTSTCSWSWGCSGTSSKLKWIHWRHLASYRAKNPRGIGDQNSTSWLSHKKSRETWHGIVPVAQILGAIEDLLKVLGAFEDQLLSLQRSRTHSIVLLDSRARCCWARHAWHALVQISRWVHDLYYYTWWGQL
jgi:hypothetical protein